VFPGDWQVCAAPPRADAPPRPLNDRDYEFAGGVLRVPARPGRSPTVLVYGEVALNGPFAIAIEAKNLNECGISAPQGGPDACRILLRNPATPAGAGGPWQRIEIRREHGDLTCSVDGRPAYAVEGRRSAPGRFQITLPPGGSCELRRFTLSAGDPPPNPPRRDGQRPPPPR
jgi:hypothetical protein